MGESPLALVLTCRYLNYLCNMSYRDITYTMVHDSQCKKPSIPAYIKSVKYHMGPTGWKHEKIILEVVPLTELQNNCNRSINVPFGPNVSFVKFSNLTSFGLSGITLNNDMMLKLSELPSSLKFLSLCNCETPKGCLSQLLEGRNSLEEIQLIHSICPSPNPIKFPPGLKKLELSYVDTSIDDTRDQLLIVDLLPCTLIKDLTTQSSWLHAKIILSKEARLLKLKLNCHLIDNDFVGESLIDLKTLFISFHYFSRYGRLQLFKTKNYGTESRPNYGTESHPHFDHLDTTSLECLREVGIITDIDNLEFVLKVSKGSDDIRVWGSGLQLTEAQNFERNPKTAIEIPVTLNKTLGSKLVSSDDRCVIS